LEVTTPVDPVLTKLPFTDGTVIVKAPLSIVAILGLVRVLFVNV
jgi:hypothetical protein